MTEFRPDYAAIKAPVLSFYSISTVKSFYPWLSQNVTDRAARRQARAYLTGQWNPYQRMKSSAFGEQPCEGASSNLKTLIIIVFSKGRQR